VNSTKSNDQSQACALNGSQISKSVGYVISARSEPAFDNAYSLYGERVGKVVPNHAWIRGDVVEATKNGAPTATSSRITM
jgi:hypothetical protein